MTEEEQSNKMMDGTLRGSIKPTVSYQPRRSWTGDTHDIIGSHNGQRLNRRGDQINAHPEEQLSGRT